MTTQLSWSPSSPELQRIGHHLLSGETSWPHPALDSPLVRATDRTLARQAWEDRVRATFRSLHRALTLTERLLDQRAPLDVLSGATYTIDELHRHLALTVHILQPFTPEPSVDFPSPPAPLPASSPRGAWAPIVEEAAFLFALDLPLSARVYEGLSAITCDGAISRITEALTESLNELLAFGEAFLSWLGETLPDEHLTASRHLLPSWLLSTETLFHGSPDELDIIAGEHFSIETRPGNLGVLPPRILAALFYDTLSTRSFPLLRHLRWDPEGAWGTHYRASLTTVSIAASGTLRVA